MSLLKLVVGSFICPGISCRSWTHKPTSVGEPGSTAESLRGAAARLAFPWSFLCQMEKEGREARLSPRPRCWVHSRPRLEAPLARGVESPRRVATERASWPVSSLPPAQVHRACPLGAGTLLACRDGSRRSGPLSLDALNLMNPRSSGVRQF